jgi:hypothetical protein
MGKISIEFETDGAAFDAPQEVAVVLQRLGVTIERNCNGIVRDSNGNTVGSWSWQDTEPTFADFVARAAGQSAQAGIRYGQASFNALAEMRPDLATQIVGSARDPFHDNSRLPDFYTWVEQNW